MVPRIVVDLQDANTLFRFQGARITDVGGYILVWVEAEGRYFSEHRLVVEAALGRRLRTEEEVHHINGIRWHNYPGNLVVCEKEYHNYLDAVMRLRRGRMGLKGRLLQWQTIYAFFRWGRKLSSDQLKIRKRIKAYISQPSTGRDIRNWLRSSLVDETPRK